MVGKIKTNGSLGDHYIQDRLLASRGRNKETNQDVLTNDYVRNFMNAKSIESLDFYIMYSKKGEPPSYIEALLLYKYYKKNNRLPRVNEYKGRSYYVIFLEALKCIRRKDRFIMNLSLQLN